MRNALIYCLILSSFVLASCFKDKGNYDYHPINEINFQNFDSSKGYSVLFGQELNIAPTLVMSTDKNPAIDAYRYEWSLRINNKDTVLSTDRDIKWKATIAPGKYSLQYRVTDKSNNVEFHIRTSLQVSTEVFEGYFVLNDVNGAARLDMLSYSSTASTFTQFTDVLKKQGSTVPMQGKPLQVLPMYYVRAALAPNDYYAIFLLTDKNTNRVNQETFGWEPRYNIRYLMVGDVPQDFAAEKLIGAYQNTNSSPVVYMYKDGNIYIYSTNAGYAFRYIPVNRYSATAPTFRAAPFVATDGNMSVMYDMDARKFVTMATSAGVTMTDVSPTFNYPTGYDLVHMEINYYPEAGQTKTVYSILKDPATSKYFLLRFNMGAAQNYFQEIKGTDFASASNYAVSADLNYLFYSVGGKLYEYDLFLQTSKLMVDKGTSVINYLSFIHIFDRFGKANYVAWSKMLNVGSYDPAGTAGSNGTLEQYSIPPVNGQIVQEYKWTGLGKITSVAYRSR